ncbi:ABC transporter substrate-binding protein [Streptomyces sp. NPDC007088]|uniref:ABC transporter substrate-binding protein n=1 Tax=Streptomyces sp. NPDC007088 TaxID=3364773 RepID=UPI0036BF659C
MTRGPLTRLLAGPAAAALLLTGCTAAADTSSGTGGDATHLRVAYGWYPTCLDYAQSNPYALFGRQVLDTLLSENPRTGELEPYLADSWKSLEGGRAYEFTIRKGVTFSNGEKLTAQVVADNFETLWKMSEQGVSPTPGAYLRGYRGARTVGARKVRVEFKEPNAGFLQANVEGQFGIVAPASLAKSPSRRCAEGTIGSGPFVLDKAVQDERVEFTRREHYDWAPASFPHQGAPAVKRLTVQIVPEENLRAAGVVAGEYDLAYSMTETGLAQAKNQDAVKSVLAPDRSVVNTFVVNTSDPVLADPAVRQALQHGIDRAKLVDTFYGKGVEPATDVVSGGHPDYLDHSELLAYQPERSRSLLDAAGWVKSKGGIRAKDGRPLRLTLTFAGADIGSDASGWEFVKDNLADVGISLTLHRVSDAKQADLRKSGDWQLAVYQGASRGDADGIAAFYSTRFTTWHGQAARPEVDGLLARQAATVDPRKRRALVQKATGEILREGYGIPVFDSAQVALVRTSLRGLTFPFNSWEPVFQSVTKS